MNYDPLADMCFNKEEINKCLNCTKPECNTGNCREFAGALITSGVSHREKKVQCVETGKVYVSIIAAAREQNIKYPSKFACKMRNKRNNSINGLHFQFV